MTNQLQSQEDLQKIIYIFAEVYKYPDQAYYDEVYSRQVDEELSALFSEIKLIIEPQFKEHCPSLEELQLQFMDLFSGIKQPFAPPIESVYKVWTTDSSAKVSIANRKGYLMGDAALHMKHLYKQYQIEVPSGYENTPDHLTLQLEFLAYLHEGDNVEAIKQFISEHLDWLDDFINDLGKLEGSRFYLYATKLLQSFLQKY